MLLSHQRKELHQQKQNLQNRHYFEFLRYLLVIQVEVGILFLSLYSSDLSPIGKFLVNMKRWIKDKISDYTQLSNLIREFFVAPNAR